MDKLPLEGVRIMDMTVVWAGPYSTWLLADWGAEVIRLENTQMMLFGTRGQLAHPPASLVAQGGMQAPYPDKDPGKRPWNRVAGHNSLARNKLSMTVDLRQPKGKEIFYRLVEKSDMLIENNVPETIEKLGFTYEELSKVNPKLIMVRMPAYGLSGPYKNYRSLGSQLEDTVGHTSVRGYTDTDISLRGDVFTADAAAGVMAALAAVMALRHRNRTGEGQQIEFAQSENFLSFLGQSIMEYTMNGRVPESWGNRHPSKAPHGCYPCKGEDRWAVIAVGNDQEWHGLCRAIGDGALAKDPRFSDSLTRYKNQDDLDEIISEWTKEREPYEVFHILKAEGVPAGPVMEVTDAFSDPHLKERGFFEPVTHPEAGTHLYVGPIWRMAETPNHLRRPPPLLGEHNEYVYKEVLGVSDEEYAELEKEGHIGMEFAEHVP